MTDPSPLIRAAGYVRVSTALQARGASLDAQRANVRKRIDYGDGGQPWELVEVFADAGRSGRKSENRPGLQAMLARLDEFDRLVVPDLTRLGRSAVGLYALYGQLEQANVALVSIRDGFDTSTAAGRLLRAVLSAVAEMESDRIAERLESHRERKVAEGLHNGGRRPLGYNFNGKSGLIVNAAEAETVKRIFAEYLGGKSMRQVAVSLNTSGVPGSRGGQWSSGRVKDVLENVAYRGDLGSRLHENIRPGQHEAIISRETFAKAEARRKAQRAQPAHGRGRPTNALLPGGFLRCMECESGMRPQANRPSYRCSGVDEHRPAICDLPSIPRDLLDGTLRTYFLEHVFDPDLSRREWEAERERATAEAREAWNGAERDARAAGERRKRIKRDYADGALTAAEWRELDGELAAEGKAAAERAEREKRRLDALLAPEDASFADWQALRETALSDLSDSADREQLRGVLQRLFEWIGVGRIDPNGSVADGSDAADFDGPTFEHKGERYGLLLEVRPEAMAWLASDDPTDPYYGGVKPVGLPLAAADAASESQIDPAGGNAKVNGTAARCARAAGS